jgi:formiminotetrahydrofolate cyclodeaminase
MVALLTANSPKYAAVAQRCTDVAHTAQTLSGELLKLVDDDAAAFDRVSAAYRLPKSSDTEKSARSEHIQSALAEAIGPPLRVIAAALQISELAAVLVDIGTRARAHTQRVQEQLAQVSLLGEVILGKLTRDRALST